MKIPAEHKKRGRDHFPIFHEDRVAQECATHPQEQFGLRERWESGPGHALDQPAPQRILVTGGAGFIGSHTVDLLLSQGKDVVVLDNLASGKLQNLNLSHPNLEFIEGNVLEFPLVEELVKDCDAILHLAALVSVPVSIEEPILSLQINTQGLLHILQASLKASRAIRLVYASSAAVYGNTASLPCQEDAPLTGRPLSPYALQKIHAENYADLYARLHGIQGLALRYFNVYGPRQEAQSPYSGVISHFIEDRHNHNAVTLFGDGTQSRDFIHVTDVARANVLALASTYNGAVNIATGKPHSLLEVLAYLQAADQKSPSIHYQAPRPGDVKASYAATQLAAIELGFKYSVSLSQGLKSMVEQLGHIPE